MIRSNFKTLDRFGIQGKIGFDHTNPHADAALFKEMQKYKFFYYYNNYYLLLLQS